MVSSICNLGADVGQSVKEGASMQSPTAEMMFDCLAFMRTPHPTPPLTIFKKKKKKKKKSKNSGAHLERKSMLTV